MAQVALVTGASSGIGAALARALAAEGWCVGLLARRVERLEEVAREVRAAGGEALVVPCDVRDREQVLCAAQHVEAALGPVDLLVANAGVGRDMDALAPDGVAFREEVEVNLLGALHAIEAVVPGMANRRRGHVVALSSLAARRGFPGAAGYCATKAGLTTLMEGLRVDWAQAGIHATTVHPGFVRTEMTAVNDVPMPFLMEADEAARRILRAVRRRRKTLAFPWQAALGMAVTRRLPDAVIGWLDRRQRRVGARAGKEA